MKILGKVRGLGGLLYADSGLERLEIHVNKKDGQGLPNQDNIRVPITLLIGQGQYQAGIRSTPRNPYIWICPDLIDREGMKANLALVLGTNGFEKNQLVELEVSDLQIRVM